MAFTTFTPADGAGLISQMVSFANTDLGWTGSSGSTIVPKAGEADFVLSWHGAAPVVDSDDGFWLKCTVTEGANSFEANMNCIPALGQCWLFGGNTPEPWMHLVVSSAPGDYHHFYLGYLERYGDWTGGAIADGTYWSSSATWRPNWSTAANHMLFTRGPSSPSNHWGERGLFPGGVILYHASVTDDIGRFAGYDTGDQRSLGQYRLRGGVVDRDHRGLIMPGLTSFNGVAPIAPFVIRADFEYDGFEVPIGSPAGIRMVHITDYDAEELIDFGGKTFQVFPLANKFRSTTYDSGNPLPDWQQGGSQYMGLALLREA